MDAQTEKTTRESIFTLLGTGLLSGILTCVFLRLLFDIEPQFFLATPILLLPVFGTTMYWKEKEWAPNEFREYRWIVVGIFTAHFLFAFIAK